MEGDPEFIVLKQWTWLDAAEYEDALLGAIVDDFLSPSTNYVPDSDTKTPLEKYSTSTPQRGIFPDFVLGYNRTDEKSAELALGRLARVSFAGSVDEAINLSGQLIRFRRTTRLDKFWEKLKNDPEVKTTVTAWLGRKGRRWPVCLVTGVMVCEHVEVSWEGERCRAYEGGVEAPLGEILLAAGIPNVLGDAADPKATVSNTRKTATLFKAKVPNAQVFALEVMKITNGAWYKKQLTLSNERSAAERGRVLGLDDNGDEPSDPADEDLLLEESRIQWTAEEREAMA